MIAAEKANLNIGLSVPAAFTGSCEIKIDGLDGGQWWVAERGVRENKRNLMIKELRLRILGIT